MVGVFRRKPAAARDVLLPGGWTVEVVGESHYQDALEAIAGGKMQHSCDLEKWAYLVREPDNPYDRNAVAVQIDGRKVGHLAREDAVLYSAILDELWEKHRLRAVCQASIGGGWRRCSTDGTVESEGSYGVELALSEPGNLLGRHELQVLEAEDIEAGPPFRERPEVHPPAAPREAEPVSSCPATSDIAAPVTTAAPENEITPSPQQLWDLSRGFEARGVNGSLVVVREGVVIRREGLKARLSQGRQADKQVAFESIALADLKRATALKNGHLYLGLHGLEVKTGFDATRDPHSVIFTKRQQPAFEKAKELIDKGLATS